MVELFTGAVILACGVQMPVDDPNIAIALIKMVTGAIPTDAFVNIVSEIYPDRVEQAENVVRQCFGRGA